MNAPVLLCIALLQVMQLGLSPFVYVFVCVYMCLPYIVRGHLKCPQSRAVAGGQRSTVTGDPGLKMSCWKSAGGGIAWLLLKWNMLNLIFLLHLNWSLSVKDLCLFCSCLILIHYKPFSILWSSLIGLLIKTPSFGLHVKRRWKYRHINNILSDNFSFF